MYGMLVAPEQSERPSMAVDSSSPPPMTMAAPPSAEFQTRDALLEFQKDWAENQGFAVVIGRSRPNRLWIKCDRGGEYSDKHLHDPENRKRKRKATRLTGCPFNVKATMKKDKIWRCHTEIGEHNHPPSEDLSIHPSLRRMTDEQLQKVNEMTEAGNTPVETLEELQRLWPGIKVLRRDIYNARKKYKTEKELADFAQGLHAPQVYEDPNGKMAGPTRTGRWEWLEDGDEVRRKKRKKSSISGATPGQSNLAPELRDQAPGPPPPQLPSPASRRQAPGLGTLPPRPFQPAQPSPVQAQTLPPGVRQAEADYGASPNASTGSPSRFRHYAPSVPSVTRSGYGAASQVPVAEPMLQHQHQQQQNQSLRTRGAIGQQESVPLAPMASLMSNGGGGAAVGGLAVGGGGGGGGAKHASGQVLMSRIERMEKEQRDQKAMLTQILGAVQGMNGLRR